MTALPWSAPTPQSSLEGCGLWTMDLDAPVPPAALAWLSDDEQARRGRFVFARDRDRFGAGRAALRWLLGTVLDRDPQSLRFDSGPHGKPLLADDPLLPFNVSHSGGTALFAIDAGRRHGAIGVDIELRRSVPDALPLAQGLFDAREQADLAACAAGAERDDAFLRAWTRKEACLKAVGAGFSAGSIPSTGIDDAPRHVQLHDGRQAWLQAVRCAQAIAALAVIGRGDSP
ncbi:4'-phosphopantetheinyl transferase superfamily protein [Variovorax dokdonensis]|uniref:4'-phosphopantetheinyl transferase superfamily protein n=1 Tax=Variovorax dokdonensis TaxID=344883 RepID=A0ABT7N5K3_9BURK|nr:4'-phosphopantetheinyl transferase superfamily protein [Variovorax dokdonensis]MDM0043200.1 4'-phosphopantetheinyl transferase superfamily protein [Variovorax dokdonensis]